MALSDAAVGGLYGMGGSVLMSIMQAEAEREKAEIEAEMARRKNMQGAIQSGAGMESQALQSAINSMAKALM